MKKKSHAKPPYKVLGTISEAEIKEFLVETANLPWSVIYPDLGPFDRWLRHWQRLFKYVAEVKPPYDGPPLEAILNGDVESSEDEQPASCADWETVQVPRDQLELFAPIVRTTLRRLWDEKDPRQRDWYAYRLRDVHRQMVRYLQGWGENALWGGADTPKRLTDYTLQEAPAISPFESAIYWLQVSHRLMLKCAGPDCAAPYFFRSEKNKRQTYCSPECGDPARREAKLRWWNESRNSPKNRKATRKPKKANSG